MKNIYLVLIILVIIIFLYYYFTKKESFNINSIPFGSDGYKRVAEFAIPSNNSGINFRNLHLNKIVKKLKNKEININFNQVWQGYTSIVYKPKITRMIYDSNNMMIVQDTKYVNDISSEDYNKIVKWLKQSVSEIIS